MSSSLDIGSVQLAPSCQIFVSFVPFCKKLPAPYAWPQEKNRRERRKRRIQDPGQCARSAFDGSRRILSHTRGGLSSGCVIELPAKYAKHAKTKPSPCVLA